MRRHELDLVEITLESSIVRRIMRELDHLDRYPLRYVTLQPLNILTHIEAYIEGPDSTPFVDGSFRVCIVIDRSYPMRPPRVHFLTQIYHPNISPYDGKVCVDLLLYNWQPTTTLRHIFIMLRSLLLQPNPESAMNEHAGNVMLADYDEYVQKAGMVTEFHAKKRPIIDATETETETETELNAEECQQ